MQTLPADLLDLIVVFQPLFTKPIWEHAKILLLGALLARGKRTVTACLRVVGLKDDETIIERSIEPGGRHWKRRASCGDCS
jgi:hypothetical protein